MNISDITIREGRYEDIPAATALGHIMHQESLYAFLPYEIDKVFDLGASAINSDNYLWLVAECDNEITGVFIGYCSEYFFCYELVAQDLAVFVHPDRRGTMTAVLLLEQYVKWATEKGCKEACLATSTGVLTEQAEKLFEKRMGFKRVGGVYKRGL